jgi:CDP-glycerol:poly(glycerophosphate) glycerophosphotransferase
VSDGSSKAAVNLVHDTVYRRARSAAADFIHRVDESLSALGHSRRRILIECASPLSMVVCGPVLEIMRRDTRLELWFTTSDDAWDMASIARMTGAAERVVPSSTAKWMKFDVYVNTDFWNMTWLPRRPSRVHMFHGVAGKYSLDAPADIAPVVATFDRLLFPNRDRLTRYAAAGLVDPDSPVPVLVGYPKVDCLVDGSLSRPAIQDGLGLDPSVPTVLYAPTWSPYSSLHVAGESIIAALARLGVNVIVKLHDRSYERSARASGTIDWRQRIEDVCRTHHVHLAQGFDVTPYLFVSDALVTDHSSVGFEFMLLDRPVVVIDCPELIEKAQVSPDKVAMLRSASRVASATGAADAVRRSLRDPDGLSERRKQVASELFYCPGTAAVRAARSIYGLLGLGMLDAVPSEAAPPSRAPIEVTALTGYEARNS